MVDQNSLLTLVYGIHFPFDGMDKGRKDGMSYLRVWTTLVWAST